MHRAYPYNIISHCLLCLLLDTDEAMICDMIAEGRATVVFHLL